MGLLRFLLLLILLYLVTKMFGKLFRSTARGTEIHGTPQAPPLDLSKKDVEDVDFKESSHNER